MITNEKELRTALLGTEAGRLFCGMLMRDTGVFAPSARLDVNATYLCEGERNVGLRVFGLITFEAGGDPVAVMKEFVDWKRANAPEPKEEENGDERAE